MARDNKTIGRFHLDGIPPAPRSVPQIEVTFDIDANGILSVTAKDKATGKEQKIRIEASTGLSQDEIARMKQEATDNAEADRQRKEEADKLNQADSLIFSTEKQLKEYGDKIPAEKKTNIETALATLKTAHESKDLAAIDSAVETLNQAWQAASEDMYKAAQESGANEGNNPNKGDSGNTGDSTVQDVDFEEVK
jgi:molecular chaperone DnaK